MYIVHNVYTVMLHAPTTSTLYIIHVHVYYKKQPPITKCIHTITLIIMAFLPTPPPNLSIPPSLHDGLCVLIIYRYMYMYKD